MSQQPALRRFIVNPNAWVGLTILVLIAAMALSANIVYPDDPMDIVGRPFLWPGQNGAFPLGTDNLGRDVTAGIFHGARVSLWVGSVSAAICLVIGVFVGAMGGYFGGWVDRLMTRLTETMQTMPSFLFLIVIVAIFEPSISSITIGIGVVSWPTIARLVRSEFRTIRNREFVLAATSLGYPHWRIILQEILPNAMPPLIVTMSVIIATAILNESALSFLGLGDPNTVSWGMMIGTGRTVIRTSWFLSAVPGVLIVVTVLAVNLLGEALNDAGNPRLAEV